MPKIDLNQFYQVLGLTQQDISELLTKEDKKNKINQSFREKAILYHSDKHPNAITLMQEITDARDKLIAFIDDESTIKKEDFHYHDVSHLYQAPYHKSLYDMFIPQRLDFDIKDEDIYSEENYFDIGDSRDFSEVKRGNLLFKFASGGKGSFTLSCLLIDRDKSETHPLITINSARRFGFFSQESAFINFKEFDVSDFISAQEVEVGTIKQSSFAERFLHFIVMHLNLEDFKDIDEKDQKLAKTLEKLKKDLYGPVYIAISDLKDFLTKLQTKEKSVSDIDEFPTLQMNLLDALRHPVRQSERFFCFASNQLEHLLQNNAEKLSEEVKNITQVLINTINRLKEVAHIEQTTKTLVYIYQYFCQVGDNAGRQFLKEISSIKWETRTTSARELLGRVEERVEDPSKIISRLSQELVGARSRSQQAIEKFIPQLPTTEKDFASDQIRMGM